MTIAAKVQQIARAVDALVQRPAWSVCRLLSPVSDTVMAADDGSLVTLLRIDGALELMGAESFSALVERITIDIDPYLSASGHTLQVAMEYDPDGVETSIARMQAASLETARALGIGCDDLLAEWRQAIARHSHREVVWMALWTHPGVLPRAERKPAQTRRWQQMSAHPQGEGVMRTGAGIDAIRDRHASWVNSLIGGLADRGVRVQALPVHEMCYEIRRMWDPQFTSPAWRPWLPGDALPLRMPDGPRHERDAGDVFYPALARQLVPRFAERIDARRARIGDRWYHPLVMTLPPKTPEPFQVLLRRLSGRRLPWRVQFMLTGDGLSAMAFKHILSMVLMPTSQQTRQVYRAIQELRERRLEGEAIVRFQAAFTTWAHDPETLRERTAQLVSAVQSWGACEVGEVTGDPLYGVAATIPGLIPKSPAPSAAAPLDEAVLMLPIGRPTSVWEDASIVLRSPDGKLMPYLQGSSRQAAWIDFGIAPMGHGKSVWLATQVFAFCLMPGLTRLPLISTIDIGPSSKGPVDLLRALLPPDRRHWAVYERIRMEPRYAVNPFDLPLGLVEPLPSHRSFLVNLCALLATEIGADAPRDGVVGIAQAAIDLAYDQLKPERNPRPYTRGVNEAVDACVDELGLEYDERTSWYALRDALFDAGRVHEATLAQRYAVPTLSDVGAAARHDSIRALYPEDSHGGVPLTQYFWRKCIEAIEAYPILKEPTRFDLGDARVIALDLDEVAPRGSPVANRQTAVMYMIARHVCASRFFVMPADVALFPERYRDYQAQRIEAVRADPKKWCLDEVHRITRNQAVAEQIVGDLEVASRESRKWNLHISLYSHDTKDIPEVILQQLATSVYLMGSGGAEMTRRISEQFNLSPIASQALDRIRKPGGHGAEMLAIHNTSSGRIVQVVVNTLAPRLVWAFSTTTEDAVVRRKLAERIGYLEALDVLSRVYPEGVKALVERRRAEREAGAESGDRSVEEALVDELATAYLSSRLGDASEPRAPAHDGAGEPGPDVGADPSSSS